MPDFERLIDHARIVFAGSDYARGYAQGYSKGKSKARLEVAALMALAALIFVVLRVCA